MEYEHHVAEAADAVRSALGADAEIAIILGSGLSDFTGCLEGPRTLPYSDVPHFPRPTVSGHAGTFVHGRIGRHAVLCLSGRSHAYEGKPLCWLTFSVHVLARLGIRLLVTSNAAGGAVPGMHEGGIMIIRDHVNQLHRNPLLDTAGHPALGARYPDLDHAYSDELHTHARLVAAELGLDNVHDGVYACWSGPSYETPFEVRSGVRFGVGAFGMSTIPEVMTCAARGMHVLALSLCTNMAAGLSAEFLTHEGVKEVAAVAGPTFVRFVRAVIERLDAVPPLRAVAGFDAAASPAYNAPLPPPAPTPLTSEQMRQAADELVARLAAVGTTAIATGALLAGPGVGLVKLPLLATIPLLDLPHWPQTGARSAVLRVHDAGAGAALFVAATQLQEGFFPEDALFIARMFFSIGVVRTLLVIAGGDSLLDPCVAGVCWLSDVADYGTVNVAVPWARPASLAAAAPLSAPQVGGPGLSYMSFPGPSRPTPAERSIARASGAGLCGIFSTAVVHACRSAGLDVHAACVLSPESGSYDATALVEQTSLAAEKIVMPAVRAEPAARVPLSPAYIAGVHAIPPLILGDESCVEAAVAEVRSRVGNVPLPVAALHVATEEAADAILAGALWDTLVLPQPIPGGLQQRLSIIAPRGKAESPVWLLTPQLAVHDGFAQCAATFGVRVLTALGCRTFISVTEAWPVGTEQSRPPVAIVHDHVNLTGRNPLYGPNVDAWGVRFPDMSGAYVQSAGKEWASLHNIPAVIAAYVVGPVFASPLDDSYRRECGCSVAVTRGVPEAIAAVHGGQKAITVLLTASSPGKDVDWSVISQPLCSLVVMIQKK